MINTIDPRYLTVDYWCGSMTLVLDPFGAIPFLESPEKWQDWARTIIQLPRISELTPPDPSDYLDWQDWAERFVEVLQKVK